MTGIGVSNLSKDNGNSIIYGTTSQNVKQLFYASGLVGPFTIKISLNSSFLRLWDISKVQGSSYFVASNFTNVGGACRVDSSDLQNAVVVNYTNVTSESAFISV